MGAFALREVIGFAEELTAQYSFLVPILCTDRSGDEDRLSLFLGSSKNGESPVVLLKENSFLLPPTN